MPAPGHRGLTEGVTGHITVRVSLRSARLGNLGLDAE